MFGLYDRVSAIAGLAALPVTAREMSLPVYLIVKRFKPSPIASTDVPYGGMHAELSPA